MNIIQLNKSSRKKYDTDGNGRLDKVRIVIVTMRVGWKLNVSNWNEWLDDWMYDRVTDWKSEWMTEWMNANCEYLKAEHS